METQVLEAPPEAPESPAAPEPLPHEPFVRAGELAPHDFTIRRDETVLDDDIRAAAEQAGTGTDR